MWIVCKLTGEMCGHQRYQGRHGQSPVICTEAEAMKADAVIVEMVACPEGRSNYSDKFPGPRPGGGRAA